MRSQSVASVPLVLADRSVGIISFGWDDHHSFGCDEAKFLEAVAHQCAQALERARLYEAERATARTLQASLLPPKAPEIPGMDVAAAFRPGDRSLAVGGDFYDVFPLDANRWALAMGDVCGRGARAAARTALVRYTLRALAVHGEGLDGPVDVLRRLNQVVLAEGDADDRFCATILGQVELDRCGAWVTFACAGHPRPIVVRRAGWIDLRGQPGTIIGVLDELDVSADRVGLGPGDALVFFTDGVTEARDKRGHQFSDERLAEVLLEAAGAPATEIATRLSQATLDFTGGSLDDDSAILVVAVPPDAGDDPAARLEAALGPGAEGSGYLPPHGGDDRRVLPPREARTVLPPDPASARAARRFLAGVLASWRMPEPLEGDAAALLLSELANNAILHARSPFTVIVRYDGDWLRVEVGDASGAELRSLGGYLPSAESGRGLAIVDVLATRWGIERTPSGKRVWFELPAPR